MQCTAHSKRTGKPCTRYAIAGGNVCIMHGGSAPQVKASAAARLAALVDPAIGVLAANMKDRKKNPAVAQRAAEDVLDRAVGKTPETIRLVGTGEDGAIQVEDVTAAQFIRRELARVAARSNPGSDS
jgi:CTP:molybdopterin cytidylyltransferase MocA